MPEDKRIKSGYDREDDLDYVVDTPRMIDGTEVLGPGYEKVLDNGMVRDLTKNGRIVYSHDFYVAMYKKLEAGMDSVAAYESLGFDTKVTGVNRAYQAAKHAREKAAANRLYTVDPGSYDGSVPPEQMLEMADLSKDELIAYLKARNYYMEELVEAQKKNVLCIGGHTYVIEAQTVKYDVFLMVDSFIHRMEGRSLHYSQDKCCRMFGVSRSGYNAWKERRKKLDGMKAAKELEEEKLKDLFREVVKKLCYVPGKRTFRTFLWRDHKVSISVKKCRRIMNEMNLVPNRPKKDAYKNRATNDHETKAPKNLVNQDFKVAPRQVILTDITYLYHGYNRNLFYLCAFKDAYTTEILGAAVGLKMDVSLVKAAYDRMMRDHGSELHEPGVLVHSDQGSQYMSTTFKQLLSDDGFIQSASRRGNSQDNAPMESFFGRMKCAILDIVAMCKSYESAKTLVENYIHAYNHTIYQNCLAGLTPAEYYIYATTGVYPCEDYYGVKPSDMMTMGEYVKKRMEMAAEKEEKRRGRNQRRKEHKEDDGKMTCPPDVRAAKDLTVLKHLIGQHKGIQKEAKAWIDKNNADIKSSQEAIEKLEATVRKAVHASVFLKGLSEEELLTLWYPENWAKYPELDYRIEMDGLYRNEPLSQYRAENGVLLTGRKYRKYVA